VDTGALADEVAARQILNAAGVSGGLVVHLGCGDGKLTVAMASAPGYLVQGLDRNPENVRRARERVQALGLCERVSIDQESGQRLPYADNLVNLIVTEGLGGPISNEELLRVLAPGGVLYRMHGGSAEKTVKPWPKDIDVWTHYLHDASGNAVAADLQVGPPGHLRWLAGPRYCRSHEDNPSISAAVTAGGRLFYIVDEGLPGLPDLRFPSRWALVARDAFSGVLLWKLPMPKWGHREWNTIGLWSAPLTLTRRLVTDGPRVFVTLGYDAPLSVLDGATGREIRTIPQSYGTDEILACDGVLLLCVRGQLSVAEPPKDNPRPKAKAKAKGTAGAETTAKPKGWQYPGPNPHEWNLNAPGPGAVVAADAATGRELWRQAPDPVVVLTLAACAGRVCYHDGQRIVCLDLKTGERQWTADCRGPKTGRHSGGTLVMHGDVVLFTGAEGLAGFSAKTGKKLWSGPRISGPGIAHPADLFVANSLVWGGDPQGKYVPDRTDVRREGLDPETGVVKRTIDVPCLISPLHHFRCYRSKATERYLLLPKRGVEFLDLVAGNHMRHDWLRAPCSYGFLPANGLLYMPPSPCFCYPGVKLTGFNALAAEVQPVPDSSGERLQRGPAYAETAVPAAESRPVNPADWPMYRHDPKRSGAAASSAPANVTPFWQTRVGGKLTPPVVAEGRLWLAQVDAHTIRCLNAADGKPLWSYTAGARIDSSPTIHAGAVLFGCCDGWVYSLRAANGVLAWRFRAAPAERLIVSENQLESTWPCHGSVLVLDGLVYCTAGRSSFLDGGIRIYALDAKTGQLRHEARIESPRPDVFKEVGRPFDMDGAKSDILVSDGQNIYMYQFVFDRTLKRVEAPRLSTLGDRQMGLHLIATQGFLDDDWWDRTFWAYWQRWPGFYYTIDGPKAGQILVFDESTVYGLHVYRRRARLSPTFTPGTGYELFADDAGNEPVLAPNSIDREKGRGYSQAAEPKWSHVIPVRARAMVLAGKTLFLAGPPDVVPQEDPLAAFEGRRGAKLWAVSTADGMKLAEHDLATEPVFDGLCVAGGRLYLVNKAGEVLCYSNRQ
jgi:outer membrane protein assembly factor BamB